MCSAGRRSQSSRLSNGSQRIIPTRHAGGCQTQAGCNPSTGILSRFASAARPCRPAGERAASQPQPLVPVHPELQNPLTAATSFRRGQGKANNQRDPPNRLALGTGRRETRHRTQQAPARAATPEPIGWGIASAASWAPVRSCCRPSILLSRLGASRRCGVRRR